MSVKSVIEIDVLDEKFQTFAKEFEKIKKALAQMPSDWSKANSSGIKSVQGVGKSLQDAKKKQDDFNKSIKDGEQALKNIATITGNIARNMANTAFSIGKFLAVGGAVSGFGLGALASTVGNQRRTAQGLGITTGQLRSADVYGSRYIDPYQTLGNLANIQTDFRQQYLLNPFGLGNTAGKNASELLPDVLRKSRDLYKQFGGQQAPLEALGVTKVVDYESLRRLAGLEEKEFKEFIDNLKQGNKQFATLDKLDKAWQDFWVKLNETTKTLQVTLIEGLESLPEPLGKLSESIADTIKSFLSNENLKIWLKELGEGIKNFATYIQSPAFKQNITDFFNVINTLVTSTVKFAKWLGIIDQSQPEKDKEFNKTYYGNANEGRKNLSLAERNFNPGNLRYAGQTGAELGEGGFAKFKNNAEGIKALENQLKLYATGKSQSAGYKKLDTIEDIMRIYAPANENDTQAYIKNLEKMTGHTRSEHLNFNDPNVLAPLITAISQIESGKKNLSVQEVKIVIQNPAGADVNVSANSIQTPRGVN